MKSNTRERSRSEGGSEGGGPKRDLLGTREPWKELRWMKAMRSLDERGE